MGRQIERLKAAQIKWLQPRTTPYPDGRGLYLRVTAENARAWLYRYQHDGRERWMGLGSFPDVTLATARQKAAHARALRGDGLDPLDARKAGRAAERVRKAGALTFDEAAARYIKAHGPTWKNDKHAAQWPATLKTYAQPIFGHLPVSAVDTGLVLKVIEPIWTTKPETANRVRGRIELVLDWATARGYRAKDNPARWRGHLDKLLPARARVQKVRNQPALTYADLPAFLAELRERGGVACRALEWTILTAARTGETIGARWDEIDLAAKVWTVPAERTKSAREHRVPLPPRAVAILKALPTEKENPFVFVGGKAGAGLSNMAMLALLKEMRPDVTVHGFRSTFRTWAREQTNYPREIAEAALAHVIGDKTEAAYARGDVLEKRRRLMTAWADYCASPPAKGARVVKLREAK